MSKKFAAFDIDGTLYRWQLFHELVQELALSQVFPNSAFRDIDTAWNKWRGGEMSFHDYEMLVVDTLVQYLPLIPLPTFEAACDKVVAQSAHKLHAYPKQLLDDLRKQGYVTIAISGSQQELLDRFAAHHDIDIAIGALYERSGNHFTGVVSRRTIGRKHEILAELVREHDLDINSSVAIGDSDGDIDILSLVERPIAFNPSAELFEHAKKHGWQIVIERKNIAYQLEKRDNALVLAQTIIY